MNRQKPFKGHFRTEHRMFCGQQVLVFIFCPLCTSPHAAATIFISQMITIMYACNCRRVLIGSIGITSLLRTWVAHLCPVLRCWTNKISSLLTFKSLPVTWCTTSLTFKNCTLCPHCIYLFCIYLRTNSDLCHLQHKLIGFYSRDEKCLQRGTNWAFK